MNDVGVGALAPPEPRPAIASPAVGPGPGAGVELALAIAERSLRRRRSIDALAFADLGEISLPPIVGNPGHQDLLHLAAPLYLASELEEAGLLDALDTTARLFASGGIRVDLGRAVRPLTEVWRTRNRRFSGEERRAFHGRLFGAGHAPAIGDGRVNGGFQPALAAFAQSLATPGVRFPGGAADPTMVVHGRQLAANLGAHAGGVPPLASRELLTAVKTAIAVFEVAEVQRWLGTRSAWSAVDAANRRYRPGRPRPDVTSHVRRGRSGVVVLSWLADALPALSTTAVPTIVVDAAIEWIDATVVLWEDRRHAG